MPQNLVKIMMGSEKDIDFCKKMGVIFDKFEVPYEYRVASAHKTPEKVLEILKEDDRSKNLVYITVAGRSNALSAFIDFNTSRPVVACPPYSDAYGGVDIFSSLRTPSGSGLTTVLEPESAALAAIKVLGLLDDNLYKKVESFQLDLKNKIYDADKKLKH